jgi:hypothetical protein
VLLTEAKRSDVKLADSFRLNPVPSWPWIAATPTTLGSAVRPWPFEVPEKRNIRADQLIRLTGAPAQADCPGWLRRVVVWDADNEREIVLLTNLLDFGATTIAAIYKERRQVELFFENSTWCTPLDVMEFQGLVAPNRPLVGSLDAFARTRIVQRPLCAESRARSHKPATPATVSTELTARQ